MRFYFILIGSVLTLVIGPATLPPNFLSKENITIEAVCNIVLVGFGLVGAATGGTLFRLVFAILINWYLVKNVQRLSREARTASSAHDHEKQA